MALTLEELTRKYMIPPAVCGPEPVPHQHHPYWVVVRSKKLNPDNTSRFKYVIGMPTEEEAQAEAVRRAEQPYEKEHEFQFFVIENPLTGDKQ